VLAAGALVIGGSLLIGPAAAAGTTTPTASARRGAIEVRDAYLVPGPGSGQATGHLTLINHGGVTDELDTTLVTGGASAVTTHPLGVVSPADLEAAVCDGSQLTSAEVLASLRSAPLLLPAATAVRLGATEQRLVISNLPAASSPGARPVTVQLFLARAGALTLRVAVRPATVQR
jgi:hypothetical protein